MNTSMCSAPEETPAISLELVELRQERAELAADALGNNEPPSARLLAVEALIAELERDAERAAVAVAILERREREAAAAAAEEEHVRILAEIAALEARREDAIAEAVHLAGESARFAGEAVQADDQVEARRRRLGQSHRSLRSGLLGDRIAIEFRDAGVQGAAAEPIRAVWRQTLLDRWPRREPEKERVALCTVCVSPDRDAIDAALAHGTSTLRELEERYGVSRSALSRHRAHSSSRAD
jgi:hypothetical protein